MDDRAPDMEQQVPEIPEYYTNSISLSLSPWDLVMDHSIRGPSQEAPTRLFRHRTSLQHAWVMAKLLDRLLCQYVKENGPITLPRALVEELGLTEEYEKQSLLAGDGNDQS